MLIGVIGLIGSGKDTIADYLVTFKKFRKESYASSVKDASSLIFGWDRNLLEGKTTQSRAWRETVDEWWSDRLSIPNLTPRYILQHLGTDVFRNHFHNDIWIASLENKLRTTTDDVVISDVRFKNELESIRKNNGIVIRVSRGEQPEWYQSAIEYFNTGDKTNLSKFNIHESEYSLVNEKADFEIQNNGSLLDLYSSIDKIVGK